MKLVIVGKGLIFDSGGYNLKIGFGCMIEFMKFDMGGVVVVFGVVKVIVVIKFEGVEVNFVVVVCENMISGGGMRFGDILIVFNGKIIEVNNIDVEGWFILVDVFVYVNNFKVDKIVDFVILIGVCIIVFGNDIGGMFIFNDEFV